MQTAAKAYGNVAKQTSSPRELEATLLLQAASRLQAVHDDWASAQTQLNDALLYNRKLWSIFLTSVTSTENPLPAAIRQNIANLGVFVMGQTVALMSNPQQSRLNPLISINRDIAAGLLGRA